MKSDNPYMTPQQEKYSNFAKSPFSLYRELSVGNGGMMHFLYYEFCTLCFSWVPGILGYGIRSFAYPRLFGRCASRPAIGKGVILRNPKKITLGRGVLMDDYSVLDARGEDAAIDIMDRVSIGRFSTVAAKGGKVVLESGVNVGSYVRIATQSSISIGESTLIAAYAYIGPGNHRQSDDGRPLIAGDMEIKGGVRIGKYCWIGAGAILVDGVTVGDGAIVGANSFVKSEVHAGEIVAGNPAKVIGEVPKQSAV
ncbi:MAG: acyltransferase [Candidatus Dadabacteria bacterium]|nr:MAG: acyltransferase [Candidatus Dadabacteria bacterium]